jgi:hypothetical protein
MNLSRRDFLRLAGLVASSAALSACTAVYNRVAPLTEESTGLPPLAPRDFAALNRMTFGPRTEERERARQIGLQAWVEEQLAFDSIDDAPLDLRLRGYKTLWQDADTLHSFSDLLFDDEDRTTVPNELRQATLMRQLFSRRQLYESVVEFWSDHFNISLEKGDCFYLKTVDDREVIRPHALGSFRDLLWASAHSPAMLTYLDNQDNRAGTPNENYARELLELHTLGVDGGYSQSDVMELARCLTGWTVKEHFWRGEFTFNPDWHDQGAKNVLGMTIEPNGQTEAEQVVEHLAAHPQTARFVVTKLARRFLGEESVDLIERGVQVFLKTNGDIPGVLRVLLLDGLAGDRPITPKFKRPVHFVTSALRQLNAQVNNFSPHLETLTRLGQLPFNWATPDGYPDHAEAWQGNFLPRWQFAFALARGEMDGTTLNLSAFIPSSDPAAMADALALVLLGAPLPAAQRDSMLTAVSDADVKSELPALLTAGIVASPAFQWR